MRRPGPPSALTFEVGDATRYAPVARHLRRRVTTAGDLTASTTPGDHPNIADSGLARHGSVNRFWTLTNAGIAFDTYDATFTFVAGRYRRRGEHRPFHRRQAGRRDVDPAVGRHADGAEHPGHRA